MAAYCDRTSQTWSYGRSAKLVCAAVAWWPQPWGRRVRIILGRYSSGSLPRMHPTIPDD